MLPYSCFCTSFSISGSNSAVVFATGGMSISVSDVGLVNSNRNLLMIVQLVTNSSLCCYFVPSQMLSPGRNAKALRVVPHLGRHIHWGLASYHFCRPHQSLTIPIRGPSKCRYRTSAMAANLVNCHWSVQVLLQLPVPERVC